MASPKGKGDMESDNTAILKEILSTVRSIDRRVTNIEREMKESRNLGAVNTDLTDSMAAMSLQASPKKPPLTRLTEEPPAPTHDNELAKELRRISQDYLTAELTETQKSKPKLVSYITETFIIPKLKDLNSGVSYMGSAYEYTTVPGKSDYDIQFFLKLPHTKRDGEKIFSAVAEKCDDAAWSLVKGGPATLLDDDGYLSTEKARKVVLSTIDKALQKCSSDMEFEGEKVVVKRSTGGPAMTLNVEWKEEKLSIDVVVCLKAADVQNSKFDLVAKPYDGATLRNGDRFWRLSYSRDELDLLRTFHKNEPRKLLLYRTMKVLKQHQSQLKVYPSYFFKNILFRLNEQRPEDGWDRIDLADRFKDMVQVIFEALDTRTLHLHFNKQVNYLANRDAKKMKVVSNYLKGIIKKGKYAELLKCVP